MGYLSSPIREGIACPLILIRDLGHRAGDGHQFLLSHAERPNLQACSSVHWGVIPVKDEIGFAGLWLSSMCWTSLTSESPAWLGKVIQPKLDGPGSMDRP